MVAALKEMGRSHYFDFSCVPVSGPRHCADRGDAAVRFCVVRHPVDRMLSGWMHESYGKVEFSDWLVGDAWTPGVTLDFKRTPQIAWWGNCNHVLKLETLDEDWREMWAQYGIEPVDLPKENVGTRVIYEPSQKDIEIITDRFAPDFRFYG